MDFHFNDTYNHCHEVIHLVMRLPNPIANVTRNYWGSEDGPYHEDFNDDGSGDTLDPEIDENQLIPFAFSPVSATFYLYEPGNAF